MRIARNLLVAALVAAPADPASAQAFRGSGPEATAPFTLAAGTAVFEVRHGGTGLFVVRLLGADGTVVGELARSQGALEDSRSIRVPPTGQYLFDISASGTWDERLRSNDAAPVVDAGSPGAARGRDDGSAAARGAGTFGWLARGFAGGALLGPIGTGLAVNFAGNSAESDALAASAALPGSDADYSAGWRQAYADRLRGRRQRAALIGGAVGTGVMVFAILKLVDIGRDEGELGGDDSAVIVIPIRW